MGAFTLKRTFTSTLISMFINLETKTELSGRAVARILRPSSLVCYTKVAIYTPHCGICTLIKHICHHIIIILH